MYVMSHIALYYASPSHFAFTFSSYLTATEISIRIREFPCSKIPCLPWVDKTILNSDTSFAWRTSWTEQMSPLTIPSVWEAGLQSRFNLQVVYSPIMISVWAHCLLVFVCRVLESEHSVTFASTQQPSPSASIQACLIKSQQRKAWKIPK